jgi:hypothetical protein
MKILKLIYFSLVIFGTVVLTLEGIGFLEPTILIGVVMWKLLFVCSSLLMVLETIGKMLEIYK